jgi:hypothetical protein
MAFEQPYNQALVVVLMSTKLYENITLKCNAISPLGH